MVDQVKEVKLCGGCEYWTAQEDDKWKSPFQCNNKKVMYNMIVHYRRPYPPKDFGCVFWEKK